MIDNKLPHNRTIIKILSVLVAFVLWLYVTDEQNPSVTRMYTVTLEANSLPNDMVVVDEPTDIKIKLRGSRFVLSEVTAEDIKAYVDLQGVEKGSHSRNVQVQLPAETQLIEVAPDKVVVNIDALSRRSIPIGVKLLGELSTDLVLDYTVLSPNHAMVYGPSSFVDQVDSVQAIFNVDQDTKGEVKARAKLVALDVSGNQVDKVTIDPESIFLTAVFKEKVTTKTIPVKVFLQGEVDSAYKITSVTAMPAEIEITGIDSLVGSILEYDINDIDVKGLKNNFSKKATILLPEGVTSSVVDIDVVVNVESK